MTAENEKTDDELANELAAELSGAEAPPDAQEAATTAKVKRAPKVKAERKPRATPAPKGGYRDTKAKVDVVTPPAVLALPEAKASKAKKPKTPGDKVRKAAAKAFEKADAVPKKAKGKPAAKVTSKPATKPATKALKPAKKVTAKPATKRRALSKLQPIGKITNARSRIRGGKIGGGMARESGMVQVTMLLHAADVKRIRVFAKGRNLSLSEATRQFVAAGHPK